MRRFNLSVIFRADDAGVNQSATDAIVACARAGLVRNVGLMVPPVRKVADLEPLSSLPDHVALGLHATITSEWAGQRWGPVLGGASVPSLVRNDGTFHPSTAELKEHAHPDEVEHEVRAQLERAHAWGLKPVYLDTHMAFTWIEGISDRMAAICQDHGLVYANGGKFQGLPKPAGTATEDARAWLMARIEAAEGPGPFVAVSHPSWDGPDTRGMHKEDGDAMRVVGNRKAEAEMLSDSAFCQELIDRGIRPVNYVEAAQQA